MNSYITPCRITYSFTTTGLLIGEGWLVGRLVVRDAGDVTCLTDRKSDNSA